ncbi:hypothetical protein RWE39_004389 [Salmonella enterica]|nr:hypothetical protein [Salmonella enterica]
MNNFVNPADPVTSPNAKQIVSKFMARIDAIRGTNQEQQQIPAPTQEVTPEQGQEQESTKVEDMQRYLAPIKMNKFNPQGYNDSHHEIFSENLSSDPIYEKIEPMIDAFSTQLKQGVQSGAISPERAQDEIENFKRDVIYPIVHEAHGPHSESHQTSLLAKKKAEIPEFVKQVTGAK